MEEFHKRKYQKYKAKYLALKREQYGGEIPDPDESLMSDENKSKGILVWVPVAKNWSLVTFEELFEIADTTPGFFVTHYIDDDVSAFDYKMGQGAAWPDPAAEGITVEESRRRAILRTMRGLLVLEIGDIYTTLSRPFPKFFNYGEQPETGGDIIGNFEVVQVTNKYDGSLVRPIRLNDEIIWATKNGRGPIIEQVETYVEKNPQYNDFAKDYIDRGYTPVFEWCSPANKIVLEYDEESLTLIGVVETYTGRMLLLDKYEHDASTKGIRVASRFEFPVGDIVANLVPMVKEATGIEGVVAFIKALDGTVFPIKIKSGWYFGGHGILNTLALACKMYESESENEQYGGLMRLLYILREGIETKSGSGSTYTAELDDIKGFASKDQREILEEVEALVEDWTEVVTTRVESLKRNAKDEGKELHELIRKNAEARALRSLLYGKTNARTFILNLGRQKGKTKALKEFISATGLSIRK